jgi:hypothetical protein
MLYVMNAQAERPSAVLLHSVYSCLSYMAITASVNNSLMCISYACVSVLVISFRSLFDVLICNIELRWLNMRLNCEFHVKNKLCILCKR